MDGHVMRDANGSLLRDGASVRLLQAPPELLHGLPSEDRAAIRWATNRTAMRVVGRDGNGNAELEFQDRSGARHWILVPPVFVAEIFEPEALLPCGLCGTKPGPEDLVFCPNEKCGAVLVTQAEADEMARVERPDER